METLATPANEWIALVVAAAFLVGVLIYLWRAYRRRRARAALIGAITAVGLEALQDVLVPDGMGGSMHVDFLLLTTRGVLVIDLRDVAGNIFGGDQMIEWTVMSGSKRSTFHNPQGALYDRVAAVRAFAGELPVEGRLLFTRRGQFPKGLPRWTMMLESLDAEFPPADAETRLALKDRYQPAWEAIREQTVPSPLRPSSSFLREVFLE
jgi:Nuclease-related domain